MCNRELTNNVTGWAGLGVVFLVRKCDGIRVGRFMVEEDVGAYVRSACFT